MSNVTGSWRSETYSEEDEMRTLSEMIADLERHDQEAADTLRILRAENERLRGALQAIRTAVSKRQLPITNEVYDLAAAALSEQEGK